MIDFSDFEDYLGVEKNYSPHTIRAYTDDLKRFADFVQIGDDSQQIRELKYTSIRAWIIELAEKGLSNRSINRKISSLQAYYRFLLQTRQLDRSPLEKHTSLKEAKKIQIPFSQKEIRGFYEMEMPENFEGIRDRLMIELFYVTGIRRAELIAVKLGDLERGRGELKVTGKGNKDRIIPLVPSVFETLEVYLRERKNLPHIAGEDRDYLFLTKKGKRLYPTLVYRVVQHYFSKLSSKHKISPHVLRHSFATHLLNEGADINSIKSLLGHESLSSTQVYTHNDIAALRKTYNKAHPRSGNVAESKE